MTSFYPAVNSRATSQLAITRLMFQLNNDQGAIQSLQDQLSTGRRINKPSEDPAAAIKALSAQRQLEFKSQVDVNLQSADTILGATESTLAQAQTLLNEMRGVAVAATGSTYSEEERDAFVAQIQAAVSKLAELGNSKFRDQFIFAGSDVLDSPFEFAGDSVRFNGNEDELRTITDFSTTLAANVSAEDSFGIRSDKIVSSVDLDPSVNGTTPLSELNGGQGVRPGSISFGNGVNSIEIDLTNAYDLNDVLNSLNGQLIDGRELRATLTNNSISLDYADGLPGVLIVEEVGSGVTANALGIENDGLSAPIPYPGSDLNPILTVETQLSQVFGGAGFTGGSSFEIQQGDDTYVISLVGLDTVEDLLNRINHSGARVTAAIEPGNRSISLQSTESGSQLSIGENGQGLASELGLRTFDLSTRLSDLNYGQGIFTSDLVDDLVITRTDGTNFYVDLDGTETVGDVLDRINNNANNFSLATRVVASLSANGNGIELTAPAGAEPIRVRSPGGSQAAWGLGLVDKADARAAGVAVGASNVISGRDVSGVEVEGVFTTLIRMRQAIESDSPEEMIRISAALEEDIQRVSLARGLIGTRQQSIQQSSELSAEQQLQLKQLESNELDADLAQTISDLAAREAALQASLQLMGRVNQLTLFDYV